MKLKLYLRMLLAAVAALFVATACDDSDEETDKSGSGGETVDLTFQLSVGDIQGATASMTVTPNVQLATYYWSAVKKSIYDGLGSDEAFLEDDLAFIRNDATSQSMTLAAYLQWKTGRGTATYTLTGLEAQTEYYAYVYGINTDGTVTSGLVKELFTSADGTGGGGEQGDGPEVEFSLEPGDPDGQNTNTTITMNILAVNGDAVSGKYIMGEKSYVDSQVQQAGSQEALVSQNGTDFSETWLASINDQGISLYNSACKPGTEYAAIILLINGDGETVKYDFCTTTGTAGEGPQGTVTMIAGINGAQKDTSMTLTITLEGDKEVASILYFVAQTSAIDRFLGQGFTYEEIGDEGTELSATAVARLNENKSVSLSFDNLNPETSYTGIIKLVGTDGNSSYPRNSCSTEAAGGDEEGNIKATVQMIAGHYETTQLVETQTSVTAVFGLEKGVAVSGKYLVGSTSAYDRLLAGGASYDQIVEANGTAFTAEDLLELNGEGVGWVWGELMPGTSYTAAVKVVDADGNSSVAYASVTTEAAGEASEAYKAWLGTWTVTSTSSEISGEPLTFDITIDQKVSNATYTVGGMFTALWRDNPQQYGSLYPVAEFDAQTGHLTLATQLIFSDQNDRGEFDYLYNLRYQAADNNSFYVSGNIGLIGLTGALTDATSGQIVGNTLQYQSGETAGTVTSMDYFYWYGGGNGPIYGTNPSEMFSATGGINYPIGPYTLVKKTDAGAPALRKAVAKADVQKCMKDGQKSLTNQKELALTSISFGYNRMLVSESIFQTSVEPLRTNIMYRGEVKNEIAISEHGVLKSAVMSNDRKGVVKVRTARNE